MVDEGGEGGGGWGGGLGRGWGWGGRAWRAEDGSGCVEERVVCRARSSCEEEGGVRGRDRQGGESEEGGGWGGVGRGVGGTCLAGGGGYGLRGSRNLERSDPLLGDLWELGVTCRIVTSKWGSSALQP